MQGAGQVFLLCWIPSDLLLIHHVWALPGGQVIVILRIELDIYVCPAIGDLHACENPWLKTPAVCVGSVFRFVGLRFWCSFFFLMAPWFLEIIGEICKGPGRKCCSEVLPWHRGRWCSKEERGGGLNPWGACCMWCWRFASESWVTVP